MHNEDSTLFSLDKLTRGATPTPQPPTGPTTRAPNAHDEDSGLIDLDRLNRATSSPRTFVVAAPPPLAPLGARPPLGGPIEESTLNGLAALDLGRSEPSRWRLPLFSGLVLAGAAAVALVLRVVLPGADPLPPPAQTIVVLAPAPPMAEEEPREGDRTDGATNAPARSAASSAAASSSSAQQADLPRRLPPKPPTHRVRPDQPKPPDPAQKPAKPKDPCAHCGGDLSCAMRCSVRGSG